MRNKLWRLVAEERLRLLVFGLIVLVGAPTAALADFHLRADDPTDNRLPDVPEMTIEEFGDALQRGRDAVGWSLDETARYIDSFFDDDRLEGEVAEGRLRLGGSVLFETDEAPRLDADVNFNLTLPNTEERLRLVVAGSVRRDDDAEERRRRRDGLDEEEERQFAADLRYALIDDLQRNLDARFSLRVKGLMPAAAFGLRYRRTWDVNDWRVRMTHQGEWETADGFEAESFLDFETEFSPELFFRVTPEIIWEEDEPGFRYGLGFTLTQRLAAQRFLQYSLAYRFETEPDHGLDEILLRARYRQTIFRDWVFGEVAPQIRLADSDGTDGTPGIMFRFQLVF